MSNENNSSTHKHLKHNNPAQTDVYLGACNKAMPTKAFALLRNTYFTAVITLISSNYSKKIYLMSIFVDIMSTSLQMPTA